MTGKGKCRKWVVAACVLGLAGVLLGMGGHWLRRKQSTPEPLPNDAAADPRLTYKGPYGNVDPNVKYVGDAACAGCHRTETEGFHRHPMSRSIVPVAQLAASQRYDPKAHNPFLALTSRFTVERKGGRVWHKQERLGPDGKVVGNFRTEAEFVIGSGRRGHSYLTTRGGFVFQTAISWFSQKHIWDLSPGFPNGRLRPVRPECLACHSNNVRPVGHTRNRYEEPVFTQAAIGCERCHGPGEVHVKARKADVPVKGGIDYTIVNPRRLPPKLREAVCQQCHLEGLLRVLRRGRTEFDFRPGLPLEDFFTVYVAAESIVTERRAVSHVEQMYRSKCFRASKGRLGCTSCHEPHEAPPTREKAVAHHRRKCLQCHETEHPCSLDRESRLVRSPQDSCIGCHMKRLLSEDVAHTAATDHTIPRVPAQVKPAESGSHQPPLPDRPLVPFFPRPQGTADADRDLGLALIEVAERRQGLYRLYLPRALDLLDNVARRDPHDVAVLEKQGQGLSLLGRREEALSIFERLLALEPNHENALDNAVVLCLNLEQNNDALKYLNRVLALNPTQTQDAIFRAALLARSGKYPEALTECQKLSEWDSLRAEPWAIRAYCHQRMGNPTRAKEALERAFTLKVSDTEQFFRWFSALVESDLPP